MYLGLIFYLQMGAQEIKGEIQINSFFINSQPKTSCPTFAEFFSPHLNRLKNMILVQSRARNSKIKRRLLPFQLFFYF